MDKPADTFARMLSFLLRLLSPPKCIICRELLEGKSELCSSCAEISAKAENRRCPICGKTPRACGCRPMFMYETDELGKRRIISLMFLGTPDSTDERDAAVRRLVYALKHDADRASVVFAARRLSFELLRFFAEEKVSTDGWVITYPPRSRGQRRKYGFDQSRQIARKISLYTGIPFEECFVRTGGKMQKTLRAHERRINADNTYQPVKNADFEGKKYLLFDDVITTGSTVNACAGILKSGGAKLVFPICVARTKRKKRSAVRSPSRKPWFLKN